MSTPQDKSILRDANGNPIPQIWDTVTEEFIAYTGEVKQIGSIPDYIWLDGDTEPDPGDDDYTRATGVEIDPATHEMTVKYWTGAAWVEVQ